MTIKEKLELLALVVQIISFPIAAWSLYWARREAKASRDLQIALNVWDSFQKHWEGGWSNAFYAVQEAQQASGSTEIPNEHRDAFYQMLNWIDWLGTLIRTGSLSETEIIFGSIGPQFAKRLPDGETLRPQPVRAARWLPKLRGTAKSSEGDEGQKDSDEVCGVRR